jgi:hypothetical protein
MDHQENPFKVSDQRRDRGCFNWLSNEEMERTPRIPFQAAMALAKNTAITKDGLNQQLLPALDILPDRCYVSPVVAMLTYNKEKPYIPLVSTTLKVMWELQQTRLWLYSKERYYESNRDARGKELKKILSRYEKKDQVEWNNELAKALNTFYATMKQRNILSMNQGDDSRRCMDDFASLMRSFTFKHFHLLEKAIYDCMCVISGRKDLRFIRSTETLVPLDYPYESDEERAECTLDMRNWFQTKQSLIQALSEKMVMHVNPDAICPIIDRHRKDTTQVYREFLPYYTLWQYAMLLDDDGILGNASKGVRNWDN